MKEKISTNKFILIGLVIILLAPFVPDFLMNIVNSDFSIFDYRYSAMRLKEIIPSFRIFGIVLTIWGFTLKWKAK